MSRKIYRKPGTTESVMVGVVTEVYSTRKQMLHSRAAAKVRRSHTNSVMGVVTDYQVVRDADSDCLGLEGGGVRQDRATCLFLIHFEEQEMPSHD
jgi:hypothetical protein